MSDILFHSQQGTIECPGPVDGEVILNKWRVRKISSTTNIEKTSLI